VANGRAPGCGVCANLKAEAADPARQLVHMREPGAKFTCLRHNVLVPFQSTDKYLTCREWEDSRTHRGIAWLARWKYKPGILYVYESEYTPKKKEFAKFAELVAPEK
jgi:hypothetical protein